MLGVAKTSGVRNFNTNAAPLIPVGAIASGDEVTFRVWAPKFSKVDVNLNAGSLILPLRESSDGYFEGSFEKIDEASTYTYILDDQLNLPDPASRYQPRGVHAPSMIVRSTFSWTDEGWPGITIKDSIIYEVHVGTFSEEGTFEGVIRKLSYLADLGITAIELMPIGEFAGHHNWGYDTAYLYAPSRNYGTPNDLRRLVNEAHRLKIAVILDVVYNHFGPDGCYAPEYGKFFTDKHKSTWGDGINLDDNQSEGVRNFLKYNALYWLEEYHIDGLRLDATHALQDASPKHFMSELSELVHTVEGPPRMVIAEDERNFSTIVRMRDKEGYGLDGVWADDFHHQLRNLAAGDEDSYYQDFIGTTLCDIAVTLKQGWFYKGQFSKTLKAARGSDTTGVPLEKFIICIQNHDQIGNRALGERLNHQIDLPMFHAVSGLLLLAPATPLLFMGQEFAASSPFLFFTDHNDDLGIKISEGRRREFKAFDSYQGEVPDPQSRSTFFNSKLKWSELDTDEHRSTLELYKSLIMLRKMMPTHTKVSVMEDCALRVERGAFTALIVLHAPCTVSLGPSYSIIFDSECAIYCLDPKPIIRTPKTVEFIRPGVLVARDNSSESTQAN